MGGMTQKRCPVCGKLHPMTAMRCSCGARLIDAPTVIVETPETPPPPIPDKSPTQSPGANQASGHWICEACHFQWNREGDSVCQLCERKRETAVGDNSVRPVTAENSYVLRFPFGDVNFTSNLAVGRDPAFCSFASQLQEFDKVSRKHAIVEVGPASGLSIVDMGSTNGTYVNGVRLDPNARSAVKVGDGLSFSKALTGQILGGTE